MDLDSIRGEMARIRQELARSRDVRPGPGAPRDVRDEVRREFREGGAPPVLMGMRVVGGAELAPLSPELARYFQVEAGVLVLDVLDGTPAQAGGLIPGDVIVAVEGETVTSISQFRQELTRGWREPPVDVRIVREGEEQILSLPR